MCPRTYTYETDFPPRFSHPSGLTAEIYSRGHSAHFGHPELKRSGSSPQKPLRRVLTPEHRPDGAACPPARVDCSWSLFPPVTLAPKQYSSRSSSRNASILG